MVQESRTIKSLKDPGPPVQRKGIRILTIPKNISISSHYVYGDSRLPVPKPKLEAKMDVDLSYRLRERFYPLVTGVRKIY